MFLYVPSSNGALCATLSRQSFRPQRNWRHFVCFLYYLRKSCTINGRTSMALMILMYVECDVRIWPAEASADPHGVTPTSVELYPATLRYRAADNWVAVLSLAWCGARNFSHSLPSLHDGSCFLCTNPGYPSGWLLCVLNAAPSRGQDMQDFVLHASL